MTNILVIKHGALGDLALAMGSFQAIRAHHPKAKIYLLTGPEYLTFTKSMPFFDGIIVDSRHGSLALKRYVELFIKIFSYKFDTIYDLQWTTRSSTYYQILRLGNLFRKTPTWSGVALGCSNPHPNKSWAALHSIDREKQQLASMGVKYTPPNFSWLDDTQSSLSCPKDPYVLLIPGASSKHPEKCWPLIKFIELAKKLDALGYHIVLLGGKSETMVGYTFTQKCPFVDNRIGKTAIEDIVRLARTATATIANDTGPAHITAIAECPTLSLFFTTNPRLSAPKGPYVDYIQNDSPSALSVDDVCSKFNVLVQTARKQKLK